LNVEEKEDSMERKNENDRKSSQMISEEHFQNLNRRPASPRCGEFEELIMVSKDRRDVWWATPGR
jgi:hypothetical protein